MDREWWTRFLDRYGAPFLVGTFTEGDDASRSILERAFSYATRIGGLVVSRDTDVEIQQAMSGAAGDAFKAFLEVCQREKSKLVIGQTLSGDTQAQGIGTGATALHSQVRDDIRQWDAARLADTLERQLGAQLLRINGVAGDVRIAWGAANVTLEASAAGPLLAQLKQAGLELTDAGITALSEQVALPLQRSAVPMPRLMGARAHLLSASEADLSAELAREFSGALAPVRQAVLNAGSMEELEQTLSALYADWPAQRVAGLLEQASRAFLSIR
jgi:phage gp29-like protein